MLLEGGPGPAQCKQRAAAVQLDRAGFVLGMVLGERPRGKGRRHTGKSTCQVHLAAKSD